MSDGFYQVTEAPSRRAVSATLPQCGACGLYKTCNSPKMVIDGDGRKRILVLGEAPGKHEDAQGKPFVGASGELLATELARFDVDLRRDCWIYNSIICRPPPRNGKDQTPTDRQVEYCRPNVLNQIRELKPDVVLMFGKSAVLSLIGWIWREDVGPIGRWVGWQIPDRKINAWLCPNWHPAFLLHGKDDQRRDGEVAKILFRRYLKRALSKVGSTPWVDGPPDATKRIRVVVDDDEATKFLQGVIEDGGPVSWDIETEGLKPQNQDLKIICASVCWRGKATVAFPWRGNAVRALRRLLASDNPKIGYNLKYEHMWALNRLGVRVRRWAWDGMQAAHTLDNRRQITSLKFQAFVRLGVGPYDESVASYMKSSEKSGNASNRLREASLVTVMKYCALDSYFEYEVCDDQRAEMSLEPLE